MSDGPLLNDVTRAFAEAHRNEDVRDLALKTKRTADLDLPAALDQIAGWQIARNKLPQWAACADIVYPAHISMEQCSSQFTAQYKAEIARRLLRSLPQSAGTDGQRRDHDGPDRRIRRRFLISRPRIRSRHVRGTPIAPVRAGRAQYGGAGPHASTGGVRRRRRIPTCDGAGAARSTSTRPAATSTAPAPTRSRTARPTRWRCAICCWLRHDM